MMLELEEYAVNMRLPDDGEIVLAYGHKTYCCVEDMDEQPEWHQVTFKFSVSEYKLKKEIPLDPEESILEFCKTYEHWKPMDQDEHPSHLIGVKKWKKIPK